VATLVDSGWERLLGNLFPPRCVLCSRPGQWPCHDLCVACEASLPVLSGGGLCCEVSSTDSHGGPPCDRSFAVCAYAPPVDTLIHALKYGGQLAIGRVLGRLLARRASNFGLQLDVDCLLPVPLHPRRYAERGFNQSAEIARFAAGALALPVAPGSRFAAATRDRRSAWLRPIGTPICRVLSRPGRGPCVDAGS
jgi:predicted amidophosphoribosyltransferase